MNNDGDAHSEFTPGPFPLSAPLVAGLIRLRYVRVSLPSLAENMKRLATAHRGPVLMACWHFAFPTVIYRYRDHQSPGHGGPPSRRGMGGAGGGASGIPVLSGFPGQRWKHGFETAHFQHPGTRGAGIIADGRRGRRASARRASFSSPLFAGPAAALQHGAHPCWRFRSWDRTVLPKPFSNIVIALGPPCGFQRHLRR